MVITDEYNFILFSAIFAEIRGVVATTTISYLTRAPIALHVTYGHESHATQEITDQRSAAPPVGHVLCTENISLDFGRTSVNAVSSRYGDDSREHTERTRKINVIVLAVTVR
jgi:hypothetical protein